MSKERVVIVGGGISGLTTAYYLQQRVPQLELTLLEAGPRCGGAIVTVEQDGFLIEGGPDSVLTQKPWAVQLCRELGLGDDLQPTRPEFGKIYVVRHGGMIPLPKGFRLLVPTDMLAFVRSPMMSWPGKFRVLAERFVPPRLDNADESLASFVSRRLGDECLETVAGPLLGSIYVTEPDRLSMLCSFPRFLDMEKKYGSLIRGFLHHARSTKVVAGSMFMSLRQGMGELVQRLLAALGDRVEMNAGIDRLERTADGYRLHSGDRSWTADRVILACPAPVTARLCAALMPELTTELLDIPHVSTATVSVGYRAADVNHGRPLDGYGFIVPKTEGRQIMACTWSSSKFAGRAPDDCVLVRVFVRGGGSDGTGLSDEADLLRLARQELRELMGITAAPLVSRVFPWPSAHPQYEVGHLDRLSRIDAAVAKLPGLHLTGWPYRGNGIPDCVREAQELSIQLYPEPDNG